MGGRGESASDAVFYTGEIVTTQPAIQDRYKSDHLFLLVGTNPLPNFVAATLMLRSQGQLYLVHSDKTRTVAERLARYWAEHHRQPQFVCVNESDGADIRRHIEHALKHIGDKHVGLNYTGGTKMMAVHATQVIRDYQKPQRPVTLSYLDARTNRMYIEHGNEPAFMTEPLLYEVQPSIQDIVKLHAFRLQDSIARAVQLSELATVLAGVHQNPDAIKAWRTWCDEVLRKNTRTQKFHEWDKENRLQNLHIELPTDKSLETVARQMSTSFATSDSNFRLLEATKRSGFARIKHLCEWLDGKWLEHYVFDVLSQIRAQRPESRIHDIGMGIRPQSESDSPEYDIDIGVMQGYRLYAISCTTDTNPGMCKLKLFEAYIRARNMAGDEACVGLVCMVDTPENLQRQIVRSWDAEGKVRVFGRRDMPDLINRMAEWFLITGEGRHA
ncbi:MAG TPA: hypothetical protein DEF43_16360 [Chloroflexus aurantiacus]|uniref:Uncharacterized protein n=2 Tax=Chloroflexus aurantiacus TaxID=1108 RepID=A9WGE8_CHLAA|nr:hypothetical protein Caur_2271 [Chloroflexus aurantiacus J-10-fl]GIV92082.1 MAG: hypothetical protein KatS3mg056_0791 [Chloroflexus sp.]HBW68689.1 hypothetical protein [Chloroflexus aurantiacus]